MISQISTYLVTFVYFWDVLMTFCTYLEIRCRFTHPGLAYRHVRIIVNFHHLVIDVTNFNFHVFVSHSHGYNVDWLRPPSWMTGCCGRDAFCLVFKYLESHLWIVVVSSTVKFSSGHTLIPLLRPRQGHTHRIDEEADHNALLQTSAATFRGLKFRAICDVFVDNF